MLLVIDSEVLQPAAAQLGEYLPHLLTSKVIVERQRFARHCPSMVKQVRVCSPPSWVSGACPL